MATLGKGRSRASSVSLGAVPGFTLVDLLVSMAIIAVLISLLLPSLSGIREATRRVICSSNLRQIGLGLEMYSDDSKGELPPTEWDPKSDSRTTPSPQKTSIVRENGADTFDGLGILFASQYLNAPKVFYCPSHHGLNPFADYAAAWHEDQVRIVVNYQYRGATRFSAGQVERLSLVTDGLATRSDYSHNVGSNVLRSDFSVSWLPDTGGAILRLLPEVIDEAGAATKVSDAWQLIERPLAPTPTGP
jgi:type II secretory pathway pseudopilin PulG